MADLVVLLLLAVVVVVFTAGTAIAIRHVREVEQRRREEALPESEIARRRYELTGRQEDLDAMTEAIEREEGER
jgi:hypothetical protein